MNWLIEPTSGFNSLDTVAVDTCDRYCICTGGLFSCSCTGGLTVKPPPEK